jgi:hypothetical protein
VLRRARAGVGWPSILALAVGAVAAWVAFDNGSYQLAARSTLAIAVWWGVGVLAAFELVPLRRLRGIAGVAVPLALLALLTFASLARAPSAEKAFEEVNRVTLLLGIVLLVALLASRATVGAWADGLAAAVAVVAVASLLTRLFPGLAEDHELAALLPSVATRLNFPLGYWNGLGFFLALGVPLLVRLGLMARWAAIRGAAVAVLPIVGGAVYLTSSRGAVAAALAAVAVFLVLTNNRWEAGAVLALGGLGVAAAVAVLAPRHALVDGPLDSARAIDEGHDATLLLVAVVLAVGLAAPFVPAIVSRIRSRRAGWVIAAVAAALLLAVVVGSDPVEHFREFKRPPTSSEAFGVSGHLLSANGSGRWQFWEASVDEWRADPVVGGGAGTYEAWWAEHGSLATFIRDAHSLYVESLGELGPLGLLLTLGICFGGVALAARRAVQLGGTERLTAAALAGVATAFAVAAGIDWMWELTAVSAFALAAVALASRLGRDRDDEPSAASPTWLRAGLVGAAILVVVAQAIPLLAQREIAISRDAAARGDGDAAREAALRARDIQPWAASPYLQLALVDERLGRLDAARDAVESAIERDDRDWRLWLVAARVNTKLGRLGDGRTALERAVELNPRSPLFQDVRVSAR